MKVSYYAWTTPGQCVGHNADIIQHPYTKNVALQQRLAPPDTSTCQRNIRLQDSSICNKLNTLIYDNFFRAYFFACKIYFKDSKNLVMTDNVQKWRLYYTINKAYVIYNITNALITNCYLEDIKYAADDKLSLSS